MKSRYVRTIALFISSFVLLSHSIASGKTLNRWTDPDVYKPTPILFLHGFASGSADSWNYIKSELTQYFNDYSSTLNFLETINFNDPNGSVDTYDDGREGWADKVKSNVDELLDSYQFKGTSLKINLICHSMGGLAAREYVTNPKYGNGYLNIDKIITIGTPHAGTPIANVKKIESAIASENKYIWEVPYYGKTRVIQEAYESNYTINYIKGKYKIDIEGEAIKDMAIKSPFLMNLNYNMTQPTNIKKFAIYGEADSWIFRRLNAWFFSLYYPNEPFTCGDGIVPRDSQKGYDIMTYYPSQSYWVWQPDKIERIKADHITELGLEDKETVQKILSFLDSAKPELEITSPNPSGTTDIYESSIDLQGEVYKEYLPADTQLIINVIREADGYPLPVQTSLLKPSGSWIPNNPDSPVAEFKEPINFPGKGTYKISCQLKNPAGLTSDVKEIWVNVIVPVGTNVIVHCHNPEGKEITSIQGIEQNSVEIYDGETLIGYGANNAETHNQPIAISSGTHTIKAKFNGMTQEQTVTFNPDETKITTFIFERTEHDIYTFLNAYSYGSISLSADYGGSNNMAGVFTCGQIYQPTIEAEFLKESYPNFVQIAYTSNSAIGSNFGFFGSYHFMNPHGVLVSGDGSLSGILSSSSVRWVGNIIASGEEIFNNNPNQYDFFPIKLSGYSLQNQNFNFWYNQGIIPANYTNNSGVKLGGIYIIPRTPSSPGYFLNKLSTDLNAELEVEPYFLGEGVTNFEFESQWISRYVGYNTSINLSSDILQGVKMSSVPHDLLETGI